MPDKKLRKNLFLVFFLILSILFLGFPLPSAQAAYTPPQKLSTSSFDTIVPMMVPDIDGYLHLVWMEADEDWSRPNPGIYYSRWNGDTWSTPLKISQNTTGFAEDPSIAIDNNKIAHVVYVDDTGLSTGESRAYYIKRQTNGTWTTPTLLPHPAIPFHHAFGARIAVDTANNLHVIYSINDNPTKGGSFYYTKFNGTSWSTPILVSYNTDGTTPILDTTQGDLYADKQGNIHAVFWDWYTGVFYRKLSGDSWSTPFLISGAPDVFGAKLTVDDNGNPFVAWYQSRDRSVRVLRTVSEVWQTEEILTNNATLSFWGWPIQGITTTSKNIIAVGWGEEMGGGLTIDVAYRYYDGITWSAVDKVRTDTLFSDTPYLIRDKWDNQHLVWSEVFQTCPDILDPACLKWDLWYSVVQGTQQTIGPAGGTVTVNPNNVTLVTLDFASSALSADTLITTLIGPLPETVDPNVVTVPRAFTFGPSGTVFPANKKPTITFTYTDSELAGGDPRSLNAYVWDSQTNSYSAKSGTVNTAQKTLKVTTIDRFSLFAMAAKKVFTTFLPPFSEGMSLEEDSTIPLRFKLTYHDGSLVPEGEIVVQLKQGETLIKEFTSSDGSVRYRKKKGVYKVNVPTEELELGDYQIVVFRDGPEIARASFNLVEEGIELEEEEWEVENEQDQEID